MPPELFRLQVLQRSLVIQQQQLHPLQLLRQALLQQQQLRHGLQDQLQQHQ
jgi:hypothetical protein